MQRAFHEIAVSVFGMLLLHKTVGKFLSRVRVERLPALLQPFRQKPSHAAGSHMAKSGRC
jgi:hypothetical protein